MLVYIAEALEAQGGMTQEGIFDGSFVNNWDIGNLVADYLVFRISGGEGCSCNTVFDGLQPLSSSFSSSSSSPVLPVENEFEVRTGIIENDNDTEATEIISTARFSPPLRSPPQRHRFLSLLLDGETPLEQTHSLLRSYLGRCADPNNKKKRDLVLSPDVKIASLSPLATSPDSPPSLVAGDISDLLLLKKTVLPDPDDDLEGHDSLNDIIKTLHGEEATMSEWKKIPDDPDSSSIATTFEARQIVAKALVWADFMSEGAASNA